MPYKDKEDYNRYLREYMKKRRVKPDVKPTPVIPAPVKPIVLNPVKPVIKPLLDGKINERLARSNRVKYGGKK